MQPLSFRPRLVLLESAITPGQVRAQVSHIGMPMSPLRRCTARAPSLIGDWMSPLTLSRPRPSWGKRVRLQTKSRPSLQPSSIINYHFRRRNPLKAVLTASLRHVVSNYLMARRNAPPATYLHCSPSRDGTCTRPRKSE